MRNARLDEEQAGIKIAGRIINNLRYAEDTTLTGESKGKLKSLLMKVKEESEKNWFKIQHSKTKIMATRKEIYSRLCLKIAFNISNVECLFSNLKKKGAFNHT